MTDASVRRKSSPSSDSEDLIVIREIYDSENAQEIFEIELERAIQSGCQTIIIEPTELGEETENWIAYGNYLHRSAIGTGVFAVFSGVYWKDLRFLPLPFGFTSCLCATLYTVCWGFDPCSNYKIEVEDHTFTCQVLGIDQESATKRSSRKRQISTSSKDSLVIPPVVLVHRNSKSKTFKYAYLVVALTSFSFSLWKLS